MAFKCYCRKCEAPLYFEESVPLPQVCVECLQGPDVKTLKQWVYATARSLERSGLSIEEYNAITKRVVAEFAGPDTNGIRESK